MTTPDRESLLRSRFDKAGQGHVFDHYNDLSTDEEKDALLTQLETIEVEKLSSLLEAAQQQQQQGVGKDDTTTTATPTITPFSKKVTRITSNDDDDTITIKENAQKAGLDAIQHNKVAVLVLAGGQGTRLGFDGPKGMYDIGMPSKSSLFEMIAHRLTKLATLATAGEHIVSIPWYIMTSPLNHDATVQYMEQHKHFALDPKDVVFFVQGMLPCLTEDGKIIMESANKVAMAPDGNGGIYPSLQRSGALEDMKKRGIQYLHVFSIDNALVKPADPVFVGYCISEGADCGNKVLWKSSAHEKVGVLAERDGKPCIVEYSDISKEMAEQTDDNGRLLLGAANICNHFYTIDFLSDTILPNLGNLYHVARKKIPQYDCKTKTTVTPETNNGIKLESFIFDVFPLSKSMSVLDVERSAEFAPVKNAPGKPSDSPDTARAMLSDLSKKWVREAGGVLKGDLDSICEVSRLTSYAGEGLEVLVKGKEIQCPFQL